jgi:hypothetical protein
VTLDLDPTLRRRRPGDLRGLAEAIVRATPDDEQDWLEWKSALDLSKKFGQFSLSRAVLGMANRDPDRAAVHAGGLGYIVVGVSPGGVDGIDRIDTAKLDDGLARYLGDDGPQWSVNRMDFDGREILVVIVEPPLPGDRIFPLCASFFNEQGDGGADGTIFVRSGTKTRPATSADIRMLHRRATAVRLPSDGPDLVVSVVTKGLPVVEESKVRAILARKADQRSEAVLQEGLRRRQQDDQHEVAGLAQAIPRFSLMGRPSSPRTWDAFVAEVNTWRSEIEVAGWKQILWSVTSAKMGQVALLVDSVTVTNLLSVEIVLTFPLGSRVVAYNQLGADQPDPPDEPAPYGEPEIGSSFDFPTHMLSRFRSPIVRPVGRYGVYVETRDDGSTTVTFVVGDLRPRQTSRTEPCYIVLVEGAPSTKELTVEWTATSTVTDGVRTGDLAIPIFGRMAPEQVAEAATILRQ